ncbi:hypothetical protein [Hymenobacter terrenus]|uniref:hypothetical protein n=1 Tax=Hymenobacter terrenus TaxID=1629124 RepID=UPI000619FAE9|nr:hypothetical protein [Hymenobacter terrenus]
MRKFKGLRPQDVVVLLKLAADGENPQWLGKDLARALSLSPSEVSESLSRCRYSRLLASDPGSYRVHGRALLDFLLHGLPYVFAVHPGPRARGLATGPSAPPLSHTFGVEPAYVWPLAAGEVWGAAVEPLYPGAAAAAQQDARLHELLALVDALRLGRPRERHLAAKLLEEALVPVSAPRHAG